MRLSWNEIRVRAKSFADDWSDAAYERIHKSEEAKTMIANVTLSSIRSSRAPTREPAQIVCAYGALIPVKLDTGFRRYERSGGVNT